MKEKYLRFHKVFEENGKFGIRNHDGDVVLSASYDFLRTPYVYVDDMRTMPVIAEKDGKWDSSILTEKTPSWLLSSMTILSYVKRNHGLYVNAARRRHCYNQSVDKIIDTSICCGAKSDIAGIALQYLTLLSIELSHYRCTPIRLREYFLTKIS